MAFEDYAAPAGVALGGAADIYSFINNLEAKKQQNKLYETLSDPKKLAAWVQGLQTPLTSNAINAVNRDIGANWATQTGGAPGGALNQYTADAFAKLESGRQQDTLQRAIQALSQAGGQIPQGGGGGNLMNILRSLMILRAIRQQPPTPTTPGITQPQPSPDTGGLAGGSEAFRGDRETYQPPVQTADVGQEM
jgi:hypothetical protein